MNYVLKNFKNWVKNNKVEFAILIAILLLASFLRLYKIAGYMTFLGDEGRDVMIVRRIFTELHPPLIGPGTSIGSMYLGPLYYYMMAPALLIANFSPVGPAVMIAVLGVITVFFVWYVGREWFGRFAATIAALFYAISPTVIIYSRSSWNPNIMPFFSLLCIYSIWKVWKEHSFKWLIVLGISYAFCLQSHYLGFLLLPTLGIYWFLTKRNKEFWHYSLISLILFLVLMSPLVIFDIRHGWHNFAAIKTFFTVRQSTVSLRPWNAIPNIWPIFKDVITRLPAGRSVTGGVILAVVTIFAVLLTFKKLKRNPAFYMILVWMGFGFLGLGLYKQHIYDHYYGFFFTAPFLLLGAIASQISKIKYQILKIFFIFTLLILILMNFYNSPLKSPPNMQLARAISVSRKVIEISSGERYNFALIAENNYDSGYRYFLDLWKSKVVTIDAQNTKETITDQLIVVCEKPVEKCDPTHNPKAEVANFGWSKIENSWQDYGVNIFKLIHTD